MKRIPFAILFLFLLNSCGVPERTTAPLGNNGRITPVTETRVITPSATVPIASPPETIAAPTLVPNPTATNDTRLPPERWREWPIVPTVTERAIEIYRAGQTMGLDTHAFSKVGDCQSVKAAFMGYFDIPDRYSLGSNYAFLQQTIDNFAGHFNSDGQAVKGGFNAAAVLSPLWADPHVCLAGENPLECELRVTKPIIVIVSLEVWWDGRTAAQYESLMRHILDTIISHGAVPILATKADNVEGDNSINLTTAKLAYEYNLPLWNFWAAVQPLPAHGMDTKRNDGFHISTEAWNTRSFTGLEALDSIWRGLLMSASIPTVNPGSTLTATSGVMATLVPDPSLNGTLEPEATSSGKPNQIIFGLTQRQGEEYTFPGIYVLDLEKQQTRQIFGTGVRFQSASPDGKFLLVSQGPALYRTNSDGSDPIQLTNSLFAFGNTDAVWLSNDQIAAILEKTQTTNIAILSANGNMVSELPATESSPVGVYPTSNEHYVYWESGSCSATGVCQLGGDWVYSVDGKSQQLLQGIKGPTLAPDGKSLVSGTTSTNTQNSLVFTAPDGSSPRLYPLLGETLVDHAWSPTSDALTAIVSLRSDYSGKALGNRNFLIDPRTLAIIEYPQSNLLYPRVVWSPDGANLFWIGTLPIDNGFKIGGDLVERSSKKVTDMTTIIGQSSPYYLAVTNAAWLSLP